jgi:hypothetical protein
LVLVLAVLLADAEGEDEDEPGVAEPDAGFVDAEGLSDTAEWLTLADGETDADGVPLAEVEWVTDEAPDGDAGPELDADAELDADGEVDVEGEVDPDGEVDADEDGDGEEVACCGSAWHTVSVGCVARGAACALPAMPRPRKLPPSRVAATTLTCAKRI